MTQPNAMIDPVVLAELMGLPMPDGMTLDPAGKDYTYPHCNEWNTGRDCADAGSATVGKWWERRCIDEKGHVTREFDCRWE